MLKSKIAYLFFLFIILLTITGCTDDTSQEFVFDSDPIEIQYNSISIDVALPNIYHKIEVYEVSLYLADQLILIEEVYFEDNFALNYNHLFSDSTYTIFIKYDYKNSFLSKTNSDTISYQFTTKAYEIPIIKVKNLQETFSTVNFELDFLDSNELILNYSTSLYKEDVLIKTFLNEDPYIADTLSQNQEYKIRIDYSFDLNDNNGIQTDFFELTFLTKTIILPYFNISMVNIEHLAFSSFVEFIDLDEVGLFLGYDLYINDQLIDQIRQLSSILVLNDLHSNTTYQIHFLYEYDLLDGVGVQQDFYVFEFNTLSYKDPEITLFTIEPQYKTSNFNLVITDEDQKVISYKIELLDSNYNFISDINDELIISNLSSNTSYHLRLTVNYNLNDGSGTKYLVELIDFKTLDSIVLENTITNIAYTSLIFLAISIAILLVENFVLRKRKGL